MRGTKAKAIRYMLRTYDRDEGDKYTELMVPSLRRGVSKQVRLTPGSYRWKYKFIKRKLQGC